MSGSVFDRLQKALDVQKHEDGISALELAQLPPALRKIMKTMLRELELNQKTIQETMEALPMAEKLDRKQTDEALNTLTQQGWLIRRGEGDKTSYAVNLKKKSGSTLENSFWGKLDQKITESQGKKPTNS
jgi:hypothetical protein